MVKLRRRVGEWIKVVHEGSGDELLILVSVAANGQAVLGLKDDALLFRFVPRDGESAEAAGAAR